MIRSEYLQKKKPVKIARNLLSIHEESFNSLISTNICGLFNRVKHFLGPKHRQKLKNITRGAQKLIKPVDFHHISKTEKVRLNLRHPAKQFLSVLYLALAVLLAAGTFIYLGNNLSVYKANVFYINSDVSLFYRLQRISLHVQLLVTNSLASAQVFQSPRTPASIAKFLADLTFKKWPLAGQISSSKTTFLSTFFDRMFQYPVCNLDFWDSYSQIYSFCATVIPQSVQKSTDTPRLGHDELPDPSSFVSASGGLQVDATKILSASKEEISSILAQISSGTFAAGVNLTNIGTVIDTNVESSLNRINYGLFMTQFIHNYLVG